MSDRIIIAGVPRSGKTTLADQLGRDLDIPVRHTDDAAHLGWSEVSAEVAKWLEMEGPWIVEGVATPRAIRKFYEANQASGWRPCDRLIWLGEPLLPLIPGQQSMAKGCRTVFGEVCPYADLVLVTEGMPC